MPSSSTSTRRTAPNASRASACRPLPVRREHPLRPAPLPLSREHALQHHQGAAMAPLPARLRRQRDPPAPTRAARQAARPPPPEGVLAQVSFLDRPPSSRRRRSTVRSNSHRRVAARGPGPDPSPPRTLLVVLRGLSCVNRLLFQYIEPAVDRSPGTRRPAHPPSRSRSTMRRYACCESRARESPPR